MKREVYIPLPFPSYCHVFVFIVLMQIFSLGPSLGLLQFIKSCDGF